MFAETFFGGDLNFRTTGMIVPSSGESYILFATSGTVFGDELGLKEMWSLKGASGLKPCLFCSNVISIRSDWALVGRNIYVSDFDDSKFIRHTPMPLYESVSGECRIRL